MGDDCSRILEPEALVELNPVGRDGNMHRLSHFQGQLAGKHIEILHPRASIIFAR
jgi:hypothetical protein